MRNGKCRMHGGQSTAPTSAEGKLRVSRNGLKSGFYTRDAKAFRRSLRVYRRYSREYKKGVRDLIRKERDLRNVGAASSFPSTQPTPPEHSSVASVGTDSCKALPPTLQDVIQIIFSFYIDLWEQIQIESDRIARMNSFMLALEEVTLPSGANIHAPFTHLANLYEATRETESNSLLLLQNLSTTLGLFPELAEAVVGVRSN